MVLRDLLDELGLLPPGTAPGDFEGVVQVADVDQLRRITDLGLTPEQRSARLAALYQGIASTRPAIVKLVEGYVIGAEDLSDDDRAAIVPMFPLRVSVMAAATTGSPKVVSTPWDVSTNDGTSKRVCLPDGLELVNGGCILAYSTPLQFNCTTLTRTGSPPAGFSDFNILGRAGAPQPTPTAPPTPGQAKSGAPGGCSSAGIAGPGGGDGVGGVTGTQGSPGAPGRPGTPSALTTITITASLTPPTGGQITVATQSGPGGSGGDGGPGGKGGQGGNGGHGVTCDCTGNRGGSGAQGGTGGQGGAAGNGGNGVDAAANVTFYVPAGVATSVVVGLPSSALPGPAGQTGLGGPAGDGGNAGSGGKNNRGGSPGGAGAQGNPGTQGQPGTVSGKPAQVVVLSN